LKERQPVVDVAVGFELTDVSPTLQKDQTVFGLLQREFPVYRHKKRYPEDQRTNRASNINHFFT
jgi:hypothetical protein